MEAATEQQQTEAQRAAERAAPGQQGGNAKAARQHRAGGPQDGQGFNADARTSKITDKPVTIGGRVFHPIKQTGEITKELIELTPDDSGQEVDPDTQLPRFDKTRALEGTDLLYSRICRLLEDEHGKQPEMDWMLANLDSRVAGDLMGWLNDATEEKAGN